jgi:3-hydroxymyristoyl/3-hydroxydecanoyl-(acyl carrier protein) dehydratase
LSSFVIADDHPCLAGHFPGRPIVPGVVLLDEIAAALGVVPRGFSAVRFSRPVRPGDRVEVVGEGARFVGRVDGVVVVQGSFAAS